uniref:Uncharacterized protein n=1 Tax=Aegilops tauschii subsp. strangulata TaxID=200361 RepID=A0A453H8X2_AEGTS
MLSSLYFMLIQAIDGLRTLTYEMTPSFVPVPRENMNLHNPSVLCYQCKICCSFHSYYMLMFYLDNLKCQAVSEIDFYLCYLHTCPILQGPLCCTYDIGF